MKFVCEHCNSKYTIADEKVRSKVLKIRCKKCNNIIEVRDSSPSPSNGITQTRTSAAPKKQKKSSSLEGRFKESFRPRDKKPGQPQGTPGLFDAVKHSASVLTKKETDRVHWFVAINNRPAGPMSAQKIHSHRKNGRVDDGSLTWKEGMGDWIPMRNCKELTGLLAVIDIEAFEKAESESMPPKPEKSPKLGLFAAQSAQAKSPLRGRSMGVVADRIDAPEEEEPRKTPPPPFVQRSPSKTSFTDELSADFENFEHGVGALHTLEPPRPADLKQNRAIMIASIGFFIIAIATLGVALFGGGETVETKTVNTVEKIVEKVVYRDRLIEAPSTITSGDTANSALDTSTNKKAKAKPKQKTYKKDETDAKTRELMERMGLSAPVGGAPVGRRAEQPVSGSKGTASALTENQLKGVVNRNKTLLKSCYERALKQGEAPDDKDIRVNFRLTVGSSGMVKNVAITGEGSRIGSLQTCLLQSVKKWVFPVSAGESVLEFPFMFTPR